MANKKTLQDAIDLAFYRFLFALKQEAAKRKKAFARWN